MLAMVVLPRPGGPDIVVGHAFRFFREGRFLVGGGEKVNRGGRRSDVGMVSSVIQAR
jgi:hypothetical protein